MSDNKKAATKPSLIKRDSNGLIVQPKVKYLFNEDGMIDWRKMVRAEHLVSNRQRTQESDVSLLEDKDLLILLAGIKELSQVRGYSSVSYDVKSPSRDYVVASCTIDWIPNFETEGREISFSAIGDASPANTNSFATDYLGPIAENRAFVRCVRNFLRINVVGQDEIGSPKAMSQGSQTSVNSGDFNPKSHLSSLMKSKGITFDRLKSKLVNEKYEKAEEVECIEDIPNVKVFELIERINKAKA
tara:strand:+ start:131 stop:862 length:732 start_codon:yes stop_codon:yes gene_type:complete